MDKALVVGGRTTGLMMASELARRGIPTRCIDLSPGIDPHVRANLLHTRSLEIFQSLGIDQQVVRGSVPEKGFVFYHHGKRLGEAPHAAVASPYPFAMSQSQAHTEAVLEAHLNSFGVEVERATSLSGMEQDTDGVTVTLHHDNGTEEQCRFEWVVGCDGAHSALRQSLGLAFPGETSDTPYVLGDVLISDDSDFEPDKGHIFFHDDGDLYFFTRLPGNRHFVVATVKPEAMTAGAPSLETLQQIVATRARPDLRLSDPQWLGAFRISYRLARHYRVGRVFLAGDAAHVHSLLSGQGMNTGLQDAHNLAWKLALVAKGLARDTLFDTYEHERRPVAEDVIDTTRQITDTMEAYMGLAGPERVAFLSDFSATNPTPMDAERHAQALDLDYGDSALTLADDEDMPGGPAPGTRAPDATGIVFEGVLTTLFSIPADAFFRLYVFTGPAGVQAASDIKLALRLSDTFAAWLKPYVVCRAEQAVDFANQAVICDPHGNMHHAYAADRPCIYLIRPDGHVAHRSLDLGSVGRYADHLRSILK